MGRTPKKKHRASKKVGTRKVPPRAVVKPGTPPLCTSPWCMFYSSPNGSLCSQCSMGKCPCDPVVEQRRWRLWKAKLDRAVSDREYTILDRKLTKVDMSAFTSCREAVLFLVSLTMGRLINESNPIPLVRVQDIAHLVDGEPFQGLRYELHRIEREGLDLQSEMSTWAQNHWSSLLIYFVCDKWNIPRAWSEAFCYLNSGQNAWYDDGVPGGKFCTQDMAVAAFMYKNRLKLASTFMAKEYHRFSWFHFATAGSEEFQQRWDLRDKITFLEWERERTIADILCKVGQ